MFERYTEKARRTNFFARNEASQYGSRYIESEHLLLGIMREGGMPGTHIQSIRNEIESHIKIQERISTSAEVPLSQECKRILKYAVEEADRLGHKHVGPEHLLLGIRREDRCLAAGILQGREIAIRAKEWCCAGFQARCYQPGKREDGLGIIFVLNTKTGTRFLLEYRPRDRKPSDPIAADWINLTFCPCCGRNLAEWYASGLPPFDEAP